MKYGPHESMRPALMDRQLKPEEVGQQLRVIGEY